MHLSVCIRVHVWVCIGGQHVHVHVRVCGVWGLISMCVFVCVCCVGICMCVNQFFQTAFPGVPTLSSRTEACPLIQVRCFLLPSKPLLCLWGPLIQVRCFLLPSEPLLCLWGSLLKVTVSAGLRTELRPHSL